MSEIQQILYIVILNNKGKSKAVETHSMFRKRKEKVSILKQRKICWLTCNICVKKEKIVLRRLPSKVEHKLLSE